MGGTLSMSMLLVWCYFSCCLGLVGVFMFYIWIWIWIWFSYIWFFAKINSTIYRFVVKLAYLCVILKLHLRTSDWSRQRLKFDRLEIRMIEITLHVIFMILIHIDICHWVYWCSSHWGLVIFVVVTNVMVVSLLIHKMDQIVKVKV